MFVHKKIFFYLKCEMRSKNQNNEQSINLTRRKFKHTFLIHFKGPTTFDWSEKFLIWFKEAENKNLSGFELFDLDFLERFIFDLVMLLKLY